MIRKIFDINLEKRTGIRDFFSIVLPTKIINRLGQAENSIAYITRHTQLLPREFLMIFDKAILLSEKASKKWGYISAEAIVKAIALQEPNLARMITTPFRARFKSPLRR